MHPLSTLTAQQLLDGMAGPAYVIDDQAAIVLVGRRDWHSQVSDPRSRPDPKDLIGRNLFDFIQGEDVRKLYREILSGLRNDPDRRVELPYRCDSPGAMRECRLIVSAIGTEDRRWFLFASQLVRQAQRPPLALFDCERSGNGAPEAVGPILAICSFCHRVRDKAAPESDESAWIEPEQYYRGGGSSRVTLSHGICPRCYGRLVSERMSRRH